MNAIDEQFVAGSTESNSTHFLWRQLFRKYFRYARMTSLKISKFDFSATISNINAQFAPVNEGLNWPLASFRVRFFPCGFLTSFYCDVTIAHLSDGPFDCDVIMKKSANRCDVGHLAIRQFCINQATKTFRKYFRYARMTSLKFSKFNFTAAVDNIYAQFAPLNRGLNSANIMLQQLFRKYFLYAQMTSLKFSKFNFSATISNIYG